MSHLFDIPDNQHTHPDLSGLSAQQRLTRRQYTALEHGQHPLGVTLHTPLPLHPAAAPAQDKNAPGLRCKTCRFRERNAWSFYKCTFGGEARASHSAGTDVRAWWPACHDYQPTEGDQ